LLIDKSITKALCNEAEIEEVRYMEKTIWTKSPPAIIVNVTDTSWFDRKTYSEDELLPIAYVIKNLKDTQSAWIAMPISAEYGKDFQLVVEFLGLTLKQYASDDQKLKTDKWQFISLINPIEGATRVFVANTTSSMAPKLKVVIIDKSTYAEEKEILKKLVL
jgi:hypothetical protein